MKTKLLLISSIIYGTIITIVAFEYATRVGAYNDLLRVIEYVPNSDKENELLEKANFFETEYGQIIFNDITIESDWGQDYLIRRGEE